MKLYKKDSKGKFRELNIYAKDGYLYQISGLVEGKKIENSKLCTPKNIGKSNETTSIAQAEFEAEALIAKKIKSGYSKDINNLSEVLLPMKVSMYQKHVKKVSKDAYYSPKLNGVNGEFRLLPGDDLVLLSRGGDPYPMLEHLRQPVIDYLKSINETSINVELYKHGWHLQDITAAVKKYKPDTHEFPSNEIEAHIFDVPSNSEIYEVRISILAHSDLSSNYLKVIPVFQDVDLEAMFTKTISDGYEGIVIHNPNGLYRYNTKSLDVFKYKKTLDAEYLIVAYELDVKGNPTLVCKVDENSTLSVRPKGTQEDRRIMLDNIDKYIGSWYKIEYESLSKAGIPTKPVGLGLRDCDIKGNPLV